MTNGWIDIKNTDMMLIMGGNPAENHPCGFKWPIEAKLHRNAKMIVVDPRFTRTAATADLFLQIRAGADIAFLGGLINYAIAHGRIAREYLVNYTNASFIVQEGFKLPEDGLYSGFDPSTQIYDKSTWNYEAGGRLSDAQVATAASGTASGGGRSALSEVPPPAPSGAPPSARSSQPLTGLGNAAHGPSGAKAGAAGSHTGGRAAGHGAPPSLPPNVRVRPIAETPAVRLPAAHATVLPLHARDGRADHGDPEGSVPESRGPVHVGPRQRRHQEGRDDHLRRRLDAAYVRHADHPHGGDPSAPARQRGPGRRRRQRPPRPFQHSRRDRSGGRLRRPARLLEDAGPGRRGLRHLRETHHADRRRSPRSGTRSTTGRTRRSSPCRS